MAGKTIEGEIVEQGITTYRAFGAPPKFKDPKEFAELVDNYFKFCSDTRDVPTITGLAVYLDTDRKTLYNYRSKDDFFPTIKRALARCEAAIESRAMQGGLNATMAIFSLKNNYGWVDKTETDLTSGGEKLGTTANDEQLAQLIEARTRRADI